MSEEVPTHPHTVTNTNSSAGNAADLYGNKAVSVLTPKPEDAFRNPKTGPKFLPDKFNYRRIGTAPVQGTEVEKPNAWQPMYPIAQKPIKIQRDFEIQKAYINNQRFGAGSAQGPTTSQTKTQLISKGPSKFIGPNTRTQNKYQNRNEPIKVTQMFYPAHPNAAEMDGRRIHQPNYSHPGKDLDSFQTFKSHHMGGGTSKGSINASDAARQFNVQHQRNAFSQHQPRPQNNTLANGPSTSHYEGRNQALDSGLPTPGSVGPPGSSQAKTRIASFKPNLPHQTYQNESAKGRPIILMNQSEALHQTYGQKQLRNRATAQNNSTSGVTQGLIQKPSGPNNQGQFYQGPPFAQQLKSKFQVVQSQPQTTTATCDSNGIPVPSKVQRQQMQQQRPPSRQKLPNQAQNLDDDGSARKNPRGGDPRGGSTTVGDRPKIENFHRNLQIVNQSSSGHNTAQHSPTEDFASQYAAMSQNAIRPPSRHKDPPQNMGLDLPIENELPSLDEDSGSSGDFDLGIANAGNEFHSASKQALFKKYQTTAPFDNEEFSAPPETDIHFSDDPVIKDFINLSSNGNRGIKTSQQKKRNVAASGQNSFTIPSNKSSFQAQTQNNFFPQQQHQLSNTNPPSNPSSQPSASTTPAAGAHIQTSQTNPNSVNVNMNVNVNLNVNVNNPNSTTNSTSVTQALPLKGAVKPTLPIQYQEFGGHKPKSTALLQQVGPSSTNNKQSRFKGAINQKGTIDVVQAAPASKIQNKLQRRPPQSANHTNGLNMQRPPEARGNRSTKPSNGRLIGAATGDLGIDDFRSPLSLTQTKDILGEGGDGTDNDEIGGMGAVIGIHRNAVGVCGPSSGGIQGSGMEHNFKSQTLQFQTNLGSDFINLFAPSEQGKDEVGDLDQEDDAQAMS